MSAELLPLLQNIIERLGGIESQLGISGAPAATSGGSGQPEAPRSIRAYDAYCLECLNPFVDACNKLGGDAALLGNLVKEAWGEMRVYLLRATACKEPAQAALGPLLQPLGIKTKAISDLVKRNEWEKHTKTCQEGVQALNWLVVKPAPRDFIENYVGGSDYWANNIRREFRTTNPDHVAFCDTFKKLLLELMVYVKEYHTTGVTWNPRGVDVSAYSESGSASAAPSTTSAPTASSAPATTAPAVAKSAAPSATAAAAGGAGLFSELSKGGAITSGLKTVTKDMQTWRKEYKAGDAPAAVSAPVTKRASGPADVVKGPAKLEFQPAGSKWVVENQVGASGLVTVTIGEKKETVYIFGCAGASISVVGKCKSIVVDSCKRTTITFETVMASCEVVNSQRINITCTEKAASVAIDKTDGIIVHLPPSSMDTTVVASKSSEMNLSWIGEDGEPVERPIPEQYVHRINGLQVTADVSDLYTH